MMPRPPGAHHHHSGCKFQDMKTCMPLSIVSTSSRVWRLNSPGENGDRDRVGTDDLSSLNCCAGHSLIAVLHVSMCCDNQMIDFVDDW